MKALIFLTLLFSLQSFAQSGNSLDEPKKKEKMDEGDKQLLRRDACRKPMEALETKYSQLSKSQLEKMKSECPY